MPLAVGVGLKLGYLRRQGAGSARGFELFLVRKPDGGGWEPFQVRKPVSGWENFEVKNG